MSIDTYTKEHTGTCPECNHKGWLSDDHNGLCEDCYNAANPSDEVVGYRWKITKDHIDSGDAVGTEGPHDLDENITSNPTRFSLYDDDNICYYEGMLYGNFDGLEPLDDYGTPNAGCTYVKIDGEIV